MFLRVERFLRTYVFRELWDSFELMLSLLIKLKEIEGVLNIKNLSRINIYVI